MNLYQLILGQIPEAIYFALFMIYTKKLENKRLVFIIYMCIAYILFKMLLPFNIWFQIDYTAFTFVLLKSLYKNKSQIIDVFTFTIASSILIILSLICIPISLQNPIVGIVVNRMLLIIFFVLFKNKLPVLQNMYKKLWNRHNSPKKIKSITFRGINIIVFNILFYLINIGLIYELLVRR